jgi:thioredoxin 1
MAHFNTYENSYPSVVEQTYKEENKHTFDITNASSFQEILRNYEIVVVDVWASYCSPCLNVGPLYEQLAESFRNGTEKNEIIFLKDCIDDEYNESVHYPNIKAVPTFFIYYNGKVVARLLGGDCEKLNYILHELTDFSNIETPFSKQDVVKHKLQKLYDNQILENSEDLFHSMNNSREAVC